ncbi:MAG: hypothetical protein L6R38_004237 [Xanthoria sp. 2 TBL-2021]|nr:MAG: hypothetical protein L6R38_004237 [Xanthoria sp. 2 TBL-2021]
MESRPPQRRALSSPSSPHLSLSPQESPRPGLGRNDSTFFGQGAFLLKKTEISVHSEPAASSSDDQSSDRASITSTARDERRGQSIRTTFNNRASDERDSIHSSVWRSSEDLPKLPYDSQPLGTTVSIEAAQPAKAYEQKMQVMKGLEQAASMKRWAGEGKPAEAWGKLIKDPELWDHTGDTLVYFGYQRPQPSFRIKASLLEDTKSAILISKLQEGFQRTVKLSPSCQTTSRLRGGMKNLNLIATGRQGLPTLSENGNCSNENPIRHEIHFPAPEDASRVEILRHHITTRNLFAFRLGRPLVGLTYYQALADLHERLLMYMSREINCTDLIIRYLASGNLHNVANDPAAGAGLLAWTESSGVRWLEGWREAFVHCVGMYDNLRGVPEIRDISHASRTLLEHSHVELQARIEACEARLSAFDFDDIWLASAWPSQLPRRAFDRLRQFLRHHYEKSYKGWPPGAQGSNDRWLTRELVQSLQIDFGSLYEYYVDRSRGWDRVAKSRIQGDIDTKYLDEDKSLTDALLGYDKRFRCPHIPYPYPLLPASATELTQGKPLKQSIFSSKAKTMEKRILHACLEASNSLLVGPETTSNGLVEAFLRFEKTDLVSEGNPREVRQGRWVLLHGILQVLATMSVDTPGLWFKDVPYFLNPRLEGSPPWHLEAGQNLEKANPMLSYCWTTPMTWKPEEGGI